MNQFGFNNLNGQDKQMNLIDVLKKGMYFYPAYNHYGKQMNVKCDRCNKEDLSACIGYKDKDLCMKCVDDLTELESGKHLSNPPVVFNQVSLNPPVTNNFPVTNTAWTQVQPTQPIQPTQPVTNSFPLTNTTWPNTQQTSFFQPKQQVQTSFLQPKQSVQTPFSWLNTNSQQN